MNDGDVAAQAFDDFENVRSEEDRGAAGDHALQHGFQRTRGDGIDTFEWLIQEEDFGPVNYGGSEGQLFLHSVRIVGDQFFGLVGELHEVEQFGGALG